MNMKRILCVLLVLCFLPICTLAEDRDGEYLNELNMLNEYLRTYGTGEIVIISELGNDVKQAYKPGDLIKKTYERIQRNGRIGQYAAEFEVYTNALYLLETGDYDAALREAEDLNTSASYEKFRAYIEDGSELSSYDLNAFGTTEELYSYVMARKLEAEGDGYAAMEYYDKCLRFVDARDRKPDLQENLPEATATPTPEPTLTPEPTHSSVSMIESSDEQDKDERHNSNDRFVPTLDSEGLYRAFPLIQSDTTKEEAGNLLKNTYGFKNVGDPWVSDDQTAYSYDIDDDDVDMFGATIARAVVMVSSARWVDETIYYNDARDFEDVRDYLISCLGSPDIDYVELYEVDDIKQEDGDVAGTHELRRLSENGLLNETVDSILASCETANYAKDITIEICWENIKLYYGVEMGATFVWLEFYIHDLGYYYKPCDSDVMEYTGASTATSEPTVNTSLSVEDYLSEHWKDDWEVVVRNWNNDSSKVIRVQEALNAAGYSVGSVDGSFGKKTAIALAAWQADHMISGSSGIGTPLTNIRLLSEQAERYRGTAASGRSIAIEPATNTYHTDGSGNIEVELRNNSDFTIVAFSVQFMLFDANGNNLYGSGRWRYGTRAQVIDPGESFYAWVERADEADLLIFYVSEVQYADGTIVSDYIKSNFQESSKPMKMYPEE